MHTDVKLVGNLHQVEQHVGHVLAGGFLLVRRLPAQITGHSSAGRPDVFADTSPAEMLPAGVRTILIHGEHDISPTVTGENYARQPAPPKSWSSQAGQPLRRSLRRFEILGHHQR